jgi:LAO/AO transport system kinase
MVDDLVAGVLAGRTLAVARAISGAENGSPRGAAVLARVYPHTGRALVVGITGPPGAGKSTLVDRLAGFYRAEGHRVGIIAVDPSSPFSGGAILGDRIRMKHLVTDPGVFIRSMATRGNLGGLARATGDAVAVLDAAGFTRVIVETVGVGQDEVDIVKTAHVSVVVLVPGMGDDIQAIKAGIMEIGDVFAINKADREGVLRIEKELEALLAIGHREDGWSPPIVKTIATTDAGTAELARAIASYQQFLGEHPDLDVGRRARVAEQRVVEILRERLVRDALAALGGGELERLIAAVADRSRDPYSVVEEIVGRAWGVGHGAPGTDGGAEV